MSRQTHLSFFKTCLSGLIMGFISYNGSFSVVSITYTLTALIFGTKSLITICSTAVSQLAAGYLQTHSSRTGMSISTSLFHGFYIAKVDMRNRRKFNETRWESIKRFFILSPMNVLVLNFMWETFTILYILQTNFILNYAQKIKMNKDLERNLIIVHGITRYAAGCLAGIGSGIINHVWQRYQARTKIPCAIFNTDKTKLKLKSNERKKLLSPFNIENWIKTYVMLPGALFSILSNIPNFTGLHLLDLHTKKMITDLLVVHGGWFFLRDFLMLVLKKKEKPPVDHQAKLLKNTDED